MNFIVFFLSTSRTQLLLANHLIIQERTKYDTEQNLKISAWNYDTSIISI